ncbi:MAG: hypothetical protein Kow0042_17540 [Calditrichia bacterium]
MKKKITGYKIEGFMRIGFKIAVLTLLFSAMGLFAQSAGTTAFEFLRNQYSPRGASMGGNLVAVKHDIEATLYNPAAMSGATDRQWSLDYTDHLLDFQGGNLAYSQPFRDWGNISMNLVYFNYGSFDETDDFGTKTGATFGASEFAFSVGLSNPLGEGFDYGVGVKFIYSDIQNYNASAVALDLGLIYTVPIVEEMILGASLQNLGITLDNYTDYKEKVPLILKIGFAKKLAHLPLLLTGSLEDLTTSENQFLDRLKKFALGGEFEISEVIRLRLGYQNDMHQSVKPLGRNIFGGVSAGLGIHWRQFRLDYAYSNFGDLGSQNRIGIRGTF